MPEISERSVPDMFEDWLIERGREPEGITLEDLDAIDTIIYTRLRSLLTADQMHYRAHVLLMNNEQLVQEAEWIDKETGEPIELILRENFQGSVEELMEMANAVDNQVGLEEAIKALLGGEAGESE